MATLLNGRVQNVMLRSSTRLINKYGVGCVLEQTRTGTPKGTTQTQVVFGKYAIAFANGTLVLSENSKLLIRADAFPYNIESGDTLSINGTILTIMKSRKVTPDGINAVMWEVETSGGTIPPVIGNAAETPFILSPLNNTQLYDFVSTSGGLYSVEIEYSSFVLLSGESEYTSSDIQIASDAAFTDIVDSVTAWSSLTNKWTSSESLASDTNYYVRVRHNGTNAVTTSWSAAPTFTTGEKSSPAEIVKPTFTNELENGNYLLSSDRYKYVSQYWPILRLSEFSSATQEFGVVHWVIASDPSFSTILVELDTYGGYSVESGDSYEYNELVPYGGNQLSANTEYYAKAMYVSSSETAQSEYTDVFNFKIPS